MARVFFIIAVAFVIVAGAACPVFADSCPYCGQQYGEGAPGDESYIASIRAQHEASCSARYSSGSSGGGYSSGSSYNWAAYWEQQREQERLWQEEQERLRREEEERKRQMRLQMQQERMEADDQYKQRWQGQKAQVAGALKGAKGDLGLKDAASSASSLPLKTQEPVIVPETRKSSVYNSLKIKDIPLPSGGKESPLPTGEVDMRSSRLKADGAEIAYNFNEFRRDVREKLYEELSDWTSSTAFELTFGQFPGVSLIKGTIDRGKRIYGEMRGMNENCYNFTMTGIRAGISMSGSSSLSDFGLSDRYHRRLAGVMDETDAAAKGMVQKDIEEQVKDKVKEQVVDKIKEEAEFDFDVGGAESYRGKAVESQDREKKE